MFVVEIENLTKDYEVGFWRKRQVRALDGLSLKVESGEIFGFLGANGAGKTTTLKLLMRLIYPTAGRARILGRDINDVSMHASIGYLPENPYFYDYLTARELLNYCAELFGYNRKERERRTKELLSRVRSEEHTSELQSPCNLVCRLLLAKRIASQGVTSRFLLLLYSPLTMGLAAFCSMHHD